MKIHSFRRQLLDRKLQGAVSLMRGRVLDIGGQREKRRGTFRPPVHMVDTWEYLNIDESTKPDYCCSAERIPLEDASVDTVLMAEVLEHLENPGKVLMEAARVLRPGGTMLVSMPFLSPLHGAPYDFQRWTAEKLERELSAVGLPEAEITAMGGLCTVLYDMMAIALKKLGFKPLRELLKLVLWGTGPLWLWGDRVFSGSQRNITTGYFVVARKK